MRQVPRRQVHLDFHTSPDISGIGSRFDKAQFQAAHLESITVFAKCHHGYCYYPTRVGTVHPGMDPDFDVTGANMQLPEHHSFQTHFEMEHLPTAWGV